MTKNKLIMLMIIVFSSPIIGTAIEDKISINYYTNYNEKGTIDTIVMIQGNDEVKNLKVYAEQAETTLDSKLGFFDSSSGPAESPPTVINNGIFSYNIPVLKRGQYVKMTYASSPNKKCDEVATGKLLMTFEGGQIEKELKTKIVCENGENSDWKYVSYGLFLIIIIIVIIAIIKITEKRL